MLLKIWLANALLIFVAAAAAGVLAARSGGRSWIWMVAALAAVAGGLIQYNMLRFALRPLTQLVRTAEQVAQGNEGVRAPVSSLADPEMVHLVTVFNRALDAVSVERRRLRDLAARAQDAQEAERIRVARTLHEGTIQTLTALLLGLRLVRRSEDRAEREAVLDAMRNDLVAATEAVRHAAAELRPAALSELGVGGAIEGYAREACAAAGVHLQFSADAVEGLEPEGATNLYRILQEAVDNALLHARPTHLRVRITRREAGVEALVHDDGRGFEVADMLGRGPCLGLLAMEERAARSGGSVRLTSTPRNGTSVRIRFPLSMPAHGDPVAAVTTTA